MKHFSSVAWAAVLLLSSPLVSAAKLYVQPSGDDTKDCLTWGNACKTISRAVAVASANDTVNIAQGIYKFASVLSVDNKSLSFIGGFKLNVSSPTDTPNTPEGDKYSTIISADTDNNDTRDSLGITTSYSGINGSNTAKAVNLSNGNYHFENMTFTGFRGEQADSHGTVIFYDNSSLPNNTLTLQDVAVVGNINYSMGNVMAYTTSTNKVLVVMDDVLFENNRGDAGVALTLHGSAQGANISNSVFKGNVSVKDTYGWNYGVGAVWAQGGTTLNVSNSIFANNTATDSASAIQADGDLIVSNSSFSGNNSAGACAGAVKTAGLASIIYSSFYGNYGAGCAGGIQHGSATASSLSLYANLILGNTINSADRNINAPNGAINDKGYNLFGFGGVSQVTGTFTKHATSSFPTELKSEIVVGNGYYGGRSDSVKISKKSPAYNKIANDGILFYGVGKSAQYPFVSLSQAHGALKGFEGYSAGIYYFDLGGSYDSSSTPYVYIPGSGTAVFTSYVDDEGYVLAASADVNTPNSSAYSQTDNLALRTDAILRKAVFTHANFDVSEVRINSNSSGARGTFTGYSTSSNVLTKIKAFKTLPNTAETGGVWTVNYSSIGTNYFTGTARSAGDQNKDLDVEIYRANNASGITWAPALGKEALNSDVGAADELDLWVRGTSGVCNGIISTDARGLPRSDRVQAEEPVSSCDIGAFEFNDYYKIDCVDEDGLRPENTISKYSVGICFKDPNAVTPKTVIENFAGVTHPFYLVLLALTGIGLRRKRRTI